MGSSVVDDSLLRVFEYLDCSNLLLCERVSRQFRRVAKQAFRRKSRLDVYYDFHDSIRSPEQLRRIVDRYSCSLRHAAFRIPSVPAIYAVSPSDCLLTAKVISSLSARARRLKSIKIERMLVSVGAVDEMLYLPETLEELSIVNCALENDSAGTKDVVQCLLSEMLKRHSRLTKFELVSRGYCTDQFSLSLDLLNNIPDSMEYLSLVPGNTLNIIDLNFLRNKRSLRSLVLQRSFISTDDLLVLLPMAQTLTKLDITSSINVLSCNHIAGLNRLRDLRVGSTRDGMDDESLVSIIDGCREIERLEIDNCIKLRQFSLAKLDRLSRLRHLNISGLLSVDAAVLNSVSRCTRLNWLDVKFCRNIPAASLIPIISMTSLAHLDLVGVASFRRELLIGCPRIPDTIICDNHQTGDILLGNYNSDQQALPVAA